MVGGTRFNIKGRLAMLCMTNRDMVKELNKRGVKCSESEFSLALHSGANPKHELICRETVKVLEEKEVRYK